MIIDIWNIETLPPAAKVLLTANDDLLGKYKEDEVAIAASRPQGPGYWRPRLNDSRKAKDDLEARLAELIRAEMIRGFHYTRLIDEEVDLIREIGFVPTSSGFLKERLARLAELGKLEQVQADQVFAKSVLQQNGYNGDREGLFWACALPFPVEHDGVERLLRLWGGEVSSWTLDDEVASVGLNNIGTPRVLEIAIPISGAMNGRGAEIIAGRLVDLRMADLGITAHRDGIDLFTTETLPPLISSLCNH
ncbi:hypothetical protein [Ensifer canadensis]